MSKENRYKLKCNEEGTCFCRSARVKELEIEIGELDDKIDALQEINCGLGLEKIELKECLEEVTKWSFRMMNCLKPPEVTENDWIYRINMNQLNLIELNNILKGERK